MPNQYLYEIIWLRCMRLFWLGPGTGDLRSIRWQQRRWENWCEQTRSLSAFSRAFGNGPLAPQTDSSGFATPVLLPIRTRPRPPPRASTTAPRSATLSLTTNRCKASYIAIISLLESDYTSNTVLCKYYTKIYYTPPDCA